MAHLPYLYCLPAWGGSGYLPCDGEPGQHQATADYKKTLGSVVFGDPATDRAQAKTPGDYSVL